MAVKIAAIIPWVIVLCISGTETQDCNSYNILPNMHERNPSVSYTGSNPALCDDTLLTGWYRAGFYDMATTVVDENKCGTVYAFYMDIAVPTDSSEHEGRACLSDGIDDCFYYINIKVKNCGDYRIYHLSSTGFCSSAFCFHLKNESSAPSYQVPEPLVTFNHLEWRQSGTGRVPRLVFSCNFQPSTTETDLHYVVSWFANETQIGSDKIVTSSTLSDGYLYEEEITDAGLRHGITLFCSVGAQFTATSASGVRVKSGGFFAGFKIKTPTIKIEEKKEATFTFSPTVPFACENQNQNCTLKVQAEDPNMDECEGNTFITESSRCHVNVTGKTETDRGNYYTDEEYKMDYNMTIKHAQSEDSYDRKSHYTIALRTNVVHHLFWSNASLKSIPVNVFYTDSVWRNRYCSQTGDPNFKTFDADSYQFQGEGSYLMYENRNSTQSVQIKTKPCSTGSLATCGCGVAVRAGRDVFTIYTCDKSTIIDFPVCDDGVLDARTDGDRRWKVTFPSGTIVKMNLIDWPSPEDLNVDVSIHPSAADEKSTTGLCGYLDGQSDRQQGFIKADGTSTSNSTEFAQSWELTEDHFFDHTDVDKFDDLEPWPKEVLLCVCPIATKNGSGTEVDEQLRRLLESNLDCSYKEYVGKCHTDRFKQFECFLQTGGSKRRKRRAIHTHCYNLNQSTVSRRKRSVSYIVSETEAREQCETTFNASVSAKGCTENVTGVSSSFMDSCISDYRITGESFVITAALDALKDTCASIIEKDVELKSTNPTLVGELFNNSCLNDCTGQGQCRKGYCVCDSGFAGTDCSKNIDDPPIISSFLVLCDTSEGPCDTISIYGKNFLNTNTFKCAVSSRRIMVDGTTVYDGLSVENGTQRSPFEAMCSLPKSDSSSSDSLGTFVYAYNISISNDGSSFSNNSEVFVYDSLCQEMIDSNGITSFNLRNGYCFIDVSCVPDGLRNPTDNCQKCLVSNDTYNWIQIDGCSTSSATTYSSDSSWISGSTPTNVHQTDTVSPIIDQTSDSFTIASPIGNTASTYLSPQSPVTATNTKASTTSVSSQEPSSTTVASSIGNTASTYLSPQSPVTPVTATNTKASTTSVSSQEPSSTMTKTTSKSTGSEIIILAAVAVVVGLTTGVIGTILLIKYCYKKQSRPRNILESQISIQIQQGKAPASTAFNNPQRPISPENLFSEERPDKYLDSSRPGSSVSTRDTHFDFSKIMDQK